MAENEKNNPNEISSWVSALNMTKDPVINAKVMQSPRTMQFVAIATLFALKLSFHFKIPNRRKWNFNFVNVSIFRRIVKNNNFF